MRTGKAKTKRLNEALNHFKDWVDHKKLTEHIDLLFYTFVTTDAEASELENRAGVCFTIRRLKELMEVIYENDGDNRLEATESFMEVLRNENKSLKAKMRDLIKENNRLRGLSQS